MKPLLLLLAAVGLAVAAPKNPQSGKLATVDPVKAAEARQSEFYERVEIPTPAGEEPPAMERSATESDHRPIGGAHPGRVARASRNCSV